MSPYIKMTRLILMITILFGINPNLSVAKQTRKDPTIHMIVRTSPDAAYTTQTQFHNANLIRELSKLSDGLIAPLTLMSDTVIHFHVNNEIREYEVTAGGIVFNRKQQLMYPLSPQATNQLKEEVVRLRSKHYGKLIPWDQLRTEIPKFAKFSITDLETGLSYEVQRRAGSSHIDAQPLTKKDSANMKKIYKDKWSWSRRAVLIKYKEHTWAGSINGMPHGGDGIPDNAFSGHFCIHFEGSHTHKNNKLDLAHQIMNYKAAGMLEQYVEHLSPNQIAELWMVAINEQDQALLHAVTWLGNPSHEQQMFQITAAASAQVHTKPLRAKKKTTKKTTKKSINKTTPKSSLYLTAVVPVRATYTLPSNKPIKGVLQLRMVRTTPMDRWVIYQIDK